MSKKCSHRVASALWWDILVYAESCPGENALKIAEDRLIRDFGNATGWTPKRDEDGHTWALKRERAETKAPASSDVWSQLCQQVKKSPPTIPLHGSRRRSQRRH